MKQFILRITKFIFLSGVLAGPTLLLAMERPEESSEVVGGQKPTFPWFAPSKDRPWQGWGAPAEVEEEIQEEEAPEQEGVFAPGSVEAQDIPKTIIRHYPPAEESVEVPTVRPEVGTSPASTVPWYRRIVDIGRGKAGEALQKVQEQARGLQKRAEEWTTQFQEAYARVAAQQEYNKQIFNKFSTEGGIEDLLSEYKVAGQYAVASQAQIVKLEQYLDLLPFDFKLSLWEHWNKTDLKNSLFYEQVVQALTDSIYKSVTAVQDADQMQQDIEKIEKTTGGRALMQKLSKQLANIPLFIFSLAHGSPAYISTAARSLQLGAQDKRSFIAHSSDGQYVAWLAEAPYVAPQESKWKSKYRSTSQKKSLYIGKLLNDRNNLSIVNVLSITSDFEIPAFHVAFSENSEYAVVVESSDVETIDNKNKIKLYTVALESSFRKNEIKKNNYTPLHRPSVLDNQLGEQRIKADQNKIREIKYKPLVGVAKVSIDDTAETVAIAFSSGELHVYRLNKEVSEYGLIGVQENLGVPSQLVFDNVDRGLYYFTRQGDGQLGRKFIDKSDGDGYKQIARWSTAADFVSSALIGGTILLTQPDRRTAELAAISARNGEQINVINLSNLLAGRGATIEKVETTFANSTGEGIEFSPGQTTLFVFRDQPAGVVGDARYYLQISLASAIDRELDWAQANLIRSIYDTISHDSGEKYVLCGETLKVYNSLPDEIKKITEKYVRQCSFWETIVGVQQRVRQTTVK